MAHSLGHAAHHVDRRRCGVAVGLGARRDVSIVRTTGRWCARRRPRTPAKTPSGRSQKREASRLEPDKASVENRRPLLPPLLARLLRVFLLIRGRSVGFGEARGQRRGEDQRDCRAARNDREFLMVTSLIDLTFVGQSYAQISPVNVGCCFKRPGACCRAAGTGLPMSAAAAANSRSPGSSACRNSGFRHRSAHSFPLLLRERTVLSPAWVWNRAASAIKKRHFSG